MPDFGADCGDDADDCYEDEAEFDANDLNNDATWAGGDANYVDCGGNDNGLQAAALREADISNRLVL